MTRPSHSEPPPQELLERGRLTLQAIQYHERAARYKAAAASLQAAIVQAENGQSEKLHAWLELESHRFDCDLKDDLVDNDSPIRSIRLDGAHCVLTKNDSPKTETAPDSDAASSSMKTRDTTSPIEQLFESPWARMEQGAIERLESLSQSTPKTLLEDSLLQDAFTEDNGFAKPEELSDEMQTSLPDIDFQTRSHSVKQWWNSPHVWVSLFVHGVLVVCLSVVAITVASEPKILSIVSASVEAENVLLETPMEMISELETISEPLPSTPSPNLSDLVKETTLPNLPLELGSSPSAPKSVSAALSGPASDSAQASMMGSKVLAGAEFFGVKATGNTFVYIVDSSPSMRRDGAFDAARKEIVRSLNSMKPKQRYFVSFFGKEIDPMVLETGMVEKYPIHAKPENLIKTIDWLNLVQVQKDGLPPNNALAEAIGMQPDGIFLLFDGDTKVDVAKFLRRANRTDDILNSGTPKVPIHVIHFYQDAFQKQMRQVAEENGGTYRFVPRPERPTKNNR
jgi:hypothetical protein